MAAQTWFATAWKQPNWNAADWYAAAGGNVDRTMQIVATLADVYVPGRWHTPNWHAPNWHTLEWFAHGGAVLSSTGAVQTVSFAFAITQIDIWPQWVFKMGGGFTSQFVNTLPGATMVMKGTFTTNPADKFAFFNPPAALQDLVPNMRLTMTLNPLTRVGQVASRLEPVACAIAAQFVFSGAPTPGRAGRKQRPYFP